MKKFRLLILGVVFIVIGSIIFVIKNDNSREYNDNKNDKHVVTFTNVEGDNIPTDIYSEYTIADLDIDYIKSFNIETRNKFLFGVSKDTKYENTSWYYKRYAGEKLQIIAIQSYDKSFETKKYASDICNEYKNKGYQLVNYRLGNEFRINNYIVGYIKVTAFTDVETPTPENKRKYKEDFIVYIIGKDNTIATIHYVLNEFMFDEESLNKIINTVSIKENESSYTSARIENNKIIGKIYTLDNQKQMKYQLNYEYPTSLCTAPEDIENDCTTIIFKDNQKNFKVVMNFTFLSSSGNVFTNYEEWIKNRYSEMYDMSEIVKSTLPYNNKNYFKFQFTLSNEEKKENYIQLVEQLSDDAILVISYESVDEIIEEDLLKYLTYQVESLKMDDNNLE